MQLFTELSEEIVKHIEYHVDEVGPPGDSLYVPLKQVMTSRRVVFLEYGKQSPHLERLVRDAKNWLFNYAVVMSNTFAGKLNEPSKTILYWRIKPEFTHLPDMQMYQLYFRVYIDAKG